MNRFGRALPTLAALVVAGCAAGEPDSASTRPQLLTLKDLVAAAVADKPYLSFTDPEGVNQCAVPMTAVVTPPGVEILFRSPPFAPTATVNTEAGPQLNILPGLAAGRAIPYATIELWTNDFGPIWTQPVYYVRDEADPTATIQPALFGANVSSRFYSPFWRAYDVVVPTAVANRLRANPVKSVAEVLALGGTVKKGPLRLCPIVPPDVVVDPALRPLPVVPPETRPPSGPPPVGSFPGLWDAVYRAEYTDAGLVRIKRPFVGTNGAFVEGKPVSFLGFGDGLARELPGEVIESNPIYVWVDLQSNGQPRPLGLPTVAAHGPAFSGRPVLAPNAVPDWFALWEIVNVVRPAGAEPFIPGPTDGSPDPFAAEDRRATWKARIPAAEVMALPGVARYIGRLALNPSCFNSAAAAGADPLAPGATKKWADSCRFMDSQEKLEAGVPFESFRKTGTQALCVFLLWARADEVRP